MAEQDESIELKVLAFDIFGTDIETGPQAVPRLRFPGSGTAISPTVSLIPG